MSNQRPTDDIVITSVFLQEGIVPLTAERRDINRALAGISPDDQRKMKRRFRKLWRKAARAELNNAHSEAAKKSIINRYGMRSGSPNRSEKNNRKDLVRRVMQDEKVRPILKAIENATLQNKEDEQG